MQRLDRLMHEMGEKAYHNELQSGEYEERANSRYDAWDRELKNLKAKYKIK